MRERSCDRTNPAPEPACDLTCPLSLGRKRPNTSSRCSCSTCCQPLSPPRVRGAFPQSKPTTLVVRTHRHRSVKSLLSPVLPTHLQALLPILHKCSRNVRCLWKIIGMESAQLTLHRKGHSGSVLQPHAAQTTASKLSPTTLHLNLGPRAVSRTDTSTNPQCGAARSMWGLPVSPPSTSSLLWPPHNEAREPTRIANQRLLGSVLEATTKAE